MPVIPPPELGEVVSYMQEEKSVVRPVPPDIEAIIQALILHGATVDGPTERDGELVYRINEHSLTEHEIRFLADNTSLTTWEIYNYVRKRAFMSDGELKRSFSRRSAG